MSKVLLRRDLYGLALWFGAFAVVFILFALKPDLRSVTLSYRFGSETFLARGLLYNFETFSGYLYTPSFAVIFSPFYLLGPLVGDGLWRILNFGVLTYAAFRQAKRIDPENHLAILSWAVLLALPLSLGAFRNGQSTILLAGACWLLVQSALDRKMAPTLLWAVVALIAKPIAIIVLLLVGAIRLRLIPVLVLAVALVFVFPYGFAPPAYVNELYRGFAAIMFDMSVQTGAYFTRADFTAPLALIGVTLSDPAATGVRLAFALATLGGVLWIDRNCKERDKGLAIFVLAVFYMSVFNPRVEANTYALLAVPFGLAIAVMMLREPQSRLPQLLGVALFVAGLTGIAPMLKDFHLWLRPLVCTVILTGMIAWLVARVRIQASGGRPPQALPAGNG